MYSTTQSVMESHFWVAIPAISHFDFQGIKLGKN